jgi:predicted nucleic-acid-binding protein
MTAYIVDTNIVVRMILEDDKAQTAIARQALEVASMIVVPTVVFCELVWVLSRIKDGNGIRRYSYPVIATIIRRFLEFEKLVLADDEVAAGLQMIDAGGDFADGVVEYTGRNLAKNANTTFLTFDRNAVGALVKRGIPAISL